MTKSYLMAIVFCTVPLLLSAQLQKHLHKTYEIADSIDMIVLDTYDNRYEAVPWAGNTIMTETKIQLYEASNAILEHFMEKGRYDLEPYIEGTLLKLVSKDKERRAIKTSKGESFEVFELRIFIPEDFEKSGDHTWVKEVPEATLGEKDN